MGEPFKYQGKYKQSSDIPTIKIDGKDVPRADFQKSLVDTKISELPATPEGQKPTYVATGGGYGSFQKLVAFERSEGKIADHVTSIKGDDFRNHPAFVAEHADVRREIEQQLDMKAVAAEAGAKGITPEAHKKSLVDQTLSAFYSNEVNTLVGKEAVKAGIMGGKSVIYESASQFPDTVQRVQLATARGTTTELVAGDMDINKAIAENPHIDPVATAQSYKRFSERFEKELVPAFDKIRVYNTDGEKPILIAEKTGKGQELQVKDQELYNKFLAQSSINPDEYKNAATEQNVIVDDNKKMDAEKANGKDGKDPLPTAPQTPAPQPKRAGGNQL